MLKEIRCSKFRSEIQTITFHEGLNTVVGTEEGTNSAGKSTFLLILDFVFGGDDYYKKCKAVRDNVGEHSIEFKMEFDGKPYYFIRSTDNKNVVTKCDQNYKPLPNGDMTLENYNKFLALQYGLTEYGLSFRSAMSRFIRVDHRDTMDESKPFKEAKGETDEDAIFKMSQLFGKYEELEIPRNTAKEAKERDETYQDAVKFTYIKSAKGKTEYKENAARIEVLKAEMAELAMKSSEGLLDLSSEQAEQMRAVREELSNFRRQKTRLVAQRNAISRSYEETKKPFPKDYSDLLAFFPDVNVEKLSKIDDFHRGLMKILRKQLKDSENDVDAMIALADEKIDQLEKEQLEIRRIPNVAKAILERYSKLNSEMQVLQQANDAFDNKEKVKKESEQKQEELDALVVMTMSKVLAPVNKSMRELCRSLFGTEIVPPYINIKSSKSYELDTGNDNGQSSRNEGLLLFDLAVFETGRIPFIIHDSNFYPNMNNDVVEQLMEIYRDMAKGRQIFIAFDKNASPKTKEILTQTQVLHLDRDAESLFGWKFNKKGQAENA